MNRGHFLLPLLAMAVACGSDAVSDPAVSAAAADGGGDVAAASDGASDPSTDPATAKDGPVRYDKLFDGDTVRTLKISYRPGEYARQQADMTTLLGEFGANAGGPGGGGPGGGGPGGGKGGGPGGGSDLIGGDPTWVGVDVDFEEVHLNWAGLRYKGNSSLSNSWKSGIKKMPFRVTFDKFEDERAETLNQRLYGFKKLTFAPAVMDDSFLRDTMMGEILRDAGLPSAKTAYYRVLMDLNDGAGELFAGLYVAIEDPSDLMMADVFGDGDSNLYKPDGTGADWTTFNQDGFVKKNNEAAADWSDVQAAVNALLADRSDATAWRKGLEAALNVDGFLRWLAVNSAVQNWDVYGAIAHNYYLYSDPKQGGRLVWIPWDHNEAFAAAKKGSSSLTHADVGESWPLIHHVLADEVYMATYKKYLGTALTGAFAVAAVTKRATALHALIASEVVKEKAPWTQLSSAAAFEGSVAALVTYVTGRHSKVAAALAASGK